MIADYFYYLSLTLAWVGALGGSLVGAFLGLALLAHPPDEDDVAAFVGKIVGACFVISVLTWPLLKAMGVLE